MSANNWAICPRCQAKDKADKQFAADRVAETYGHISMAEHDALREQVNNWPELEASFREDYEIYGAEDGTVKMVYRGQCMFTPAEAKTPRNERRGCGAQLTFEVSKPIENLS